MNRDLASTAQPAAATFVEGRRVVAVVGIDRYATWPRLSNAVNDALGALDVFRRLGFEPIVAPLLNETATADAIRRLVTDDLAMLGSADSLVLFFAGHGHTQTRMLQSGPVQTGFLIPVDGDPSEGRTATWLRLDSWLSDVARLPARHILVILDACHSGVALGSVIKWRDVGAGRGGSLDDLRRRQSRRVITSALGDQRAMDGGPVHGHSLFTGCLIEGLTGGLARDGRPEATGSEIGLYVQRRVTSYTASQQTPDFGTLELDQRGELVVPIVPHAQPIQLPTVFAARPPVLASTVASASSELPRRVGPTDHRARAPQHTALAAPPVRHAPPTTTANARAKLLAVWKRRPVLVTLLLMSVWPFAILFFCWDKLSPRVRVIALAASIVIFFLVPLAASHSNDGRSQPAVKDSSPEPRVDSDSNRDGSSQQAAQPLTVAYDRAPPFTPPDSAPASPVPTGERASIVGTWDEVVTSTAMPNSIASDSMRHTFRADGTVTVRMDEGKPKTFRWKSAHGKYVVEYKYGQYDHPREFRLRSADEAEVVESNGYVLAAYIREGSTLAQQKTSVSIFAQVAATRNAIDVNALVVGRSYVLGRQTPLMPDPDPQDPIAALALVRNVTTDSTFVVLGKRTVSGVVWYQVRTAVGDHVTGWFNSIALLGQHLRGGQSDRPRP